MYIIEMKRRDTMNGIDRNELVDLKGVTIKTNLPVEERIKDYIEQIKNPYCYLCNGVVVKISFTGKKRLDDCLSSYIQFAGGNTLADLLTVGKEAS